MRFLAIGGTAFMGPQVVRRLASRGHGVAVFHRGKTKADLPAGVKEFLGDRRKLGEHAEPLRDFRPEVVVDMMLVTEADARGVMTVFAGVAERIVAVSSIDAVKAYGVLLGTEEGPPVPAPFDEDTPVREKLFPFRGKATGMDDYDKVLVERECLAHPGLPAAVLRLPMVYGPGDRQHRLHDLLRRFDAGRAAIAMDASIAPWRGARGYVENVAEAIALAAEDPRSAGRIYNVAEDPTLDERAWTAAVAAAAGWIGRVVEIPSAKLPEPLRAGMNTTQHLWASTARIRRELGYRETVGFDEGLKRTVAWERANPPPSRPGEAETDAAEEKILRETGGL